MRDEPQRARMHVLTFFQTIFVSGTYGCVKGAVRTVMEIYQTGVIHEIDGILDQQHPEI